MEEWALTLDGFCSIHQPFPVVVPTFHNTPYDGTTEMASLSYGPRVRNDPALWAIYEEPCLKEMRNHLYQCIWPCDADFDMKFPDLVPSDWIMPLQEKKDKSTGLVTSYKARLAIMGNREKDAGLFQDPSETYCPTLSAEGARALIAHAVYKNMAISKVDSQSAFQRTPSTRPVPMVIWLPSELTGLPGRTKWYLTTLFQGCPEATKAWRELTHEIYMSCHMTESLKEPCVYIWHGPATEDPSQQGVYIFGVSTDDNLETTSQNEAGRAQQLLVRQALADNGIPTTATENPDQIVGIHIVYNPDDSMTLRPTQQIHDLAKIFYPTGGVPRVLTPMREKWNEEENNNSPPFDLTLYRRVVGILLFAGNTRTECPPAIAKAASRTRTHTDKDWLDLQHLAAYLINTSELGVTYHPRRDIDPIDFCISGSGDYAFRVFEDGAGQIGGMLVGGQPVGVLSGPILVTSHKDSGFRATSVPIGELKATVSIVQSAMSLAGFVEQLGNARRPVPIETDSQSVHLSAQGHSGNAHYIRHLRSLLVLLRQCKKSGWIDLHLVKGGKMNANSLTKPLGPLEHWLELPKTLGHQPALFRFQAEVIQRWGYHRTAHTDSLALQASPPIPPWMASQWR